MNNRGFTLVEILAVIVLLAIVALIGTSSMTAVKEKTNKKMYEDKMKFIITAARNYGEDNQNILTGNTVIMIEDLIPDYLDADENDIIYGLNNEEINNKEIKLYMENNRVYACFSSDVSIDDLEC